MPLLPCVLENGKKKISTLGLVDSGAMMNVLPHQLGLDLGGVWNDAEAELSLGSMYVDIPAMPFVARIRIGKLSPVRLVFAWAASNEVRLVLGQANFFMEFDIHFIVPNLNLKSIPNRNDRASQSAYRKL